MGCVEKICLKKSEDADIIVEPRKARIFSAFSGPTSETRIRQISFLILPRQTITHHRMILTAIAQSASSPSTAFSFIPGCSHHELTGEHRTVPRNCLPREFVGSNFVSHPLTSHKREASITKNQEAAVAHQWTHVPLLCT